MSDGQSPKDSKELRQQEAIQKSILTHLNSGVLVIDEAGRLVFINPAAREILTLKEDDLPTGKLLADLDPFEGQLEIRFGREDEEAARWEVEAAEGRVFEARLSTLPEGRLLLLQEITRYKKLDQVKTEFVNTVSHDLRSPLTAILGYVSLIDRVGPVNEHQQEFIQRAQTSVETIKNMIDKLLDLGRIEAGYDEEKVPVSIQDLLEALIGDYQATFDQKEQVPSLEMPPEPIHLLGNPTMLRQAFDNLIENAIKYTPSGGKVFVRGRMEDEQVIIQIQDTGLGIPSADLPHIFDKLYRGENVVGEESGAGLGLSIVQTIIESHQGRVWAESYPGEGSMFTVVLPAYHENGA